MNIRRLLTITPHHTTATQQTQEITSVLYLQDSHLAALAKSKIERIRKAAEPAPTPDAPEKAPEAKEVKPIPEKLPEAAEKKAVPKIGHKRDPSSPKPPLLRMNTALPSTGLIKKMLPPTSTAVIKRITPQQKSPRKQSQASILASIPAPSPLASSTPRIEVPTIQPVKKHMRKKSSSHADLRNIYPQMKK
jgi:hypothetical protein